MHKKCWIVILTFVMVSTIGFAPGVEKVTIEEILNNPLAFNGSIVQIRGYIISGMETFVIADSQTVDGIWIDYPSVDDPELKLKKDKELQKMIDGLPDWKGKKNCNIIQATINGKIEAVDKTGFIRDSNEKIIGVQGFGHLRMYKVRILVQSVSDASVQEQPCKRWQPKAEE
ncbi:MAG: hypothetical protein JXR49_17235 [Acidobacteria bacterium]|nr:hypothetical protein [Acidobacteriota bacterium]